MIEREFLTQMFEADLDLAKKFNRVGELNCARQHLAGAAEKLAQIATLDAAPQTMPIIEVK